MIIIKQKRNSNWSIQVGEKLFDKGSTTYNHLDNMITDVKPIKKQSLIVKKRKVGTAFTYKVKGGVPKYGYTLKDELPRRLRSKLYGLFK